MIYVSNNSLSVEFDCSNLLDGDYAFADCQVKYVSCVGGQAIERTCPDELELRFNPLHDRCERFEHIEACGGVPTTTGKSSLILLSPILSVAFLGFTFDVVTVKSLNLIFITLFHVSMISFFD